MNGSVRLLSVVLGGALLFISACSDSSDTSISTTTISTDSPTAVSVDTSPNSAPTSTVAIDGTEPCDLLTATEVEAATGLTVLEVREEPPIYCVFDFDADPGVAVFVSIDDGQARAAAPANVFESYAEMMDNGEAEAITGLGAGAVYAPSYRALAVDVGDGVFIAVGINGGYTELAEPRDALIVLAQAAVDRL